MTQETKTKWALDWQSNGKGSFKAFPVDLDFLNSDQFYEVTLNEESKVASLSDGGVLTIEDKAFVTLVVKVGPSLKPIVQILTHLKTKIKPYSRQALTIGPLLNNSILPCTKEVARGKKRKRSSLSLIRSSSSAKTQSSSGISSSSSSLTSPA